MNYHTTTIEIKQGLNTQGFFSFKTPETVIIFIHGFAGKSIITWNNFPQFILPDKDFSKSDLIFYGYDTFGGQAGDHASELYDFLNLMEKPLGNGILPSQQNLPERAYKKIVLVAHSLGAILARQAQILAFDGGSNWLKKSSLILFAPAHNGAQILPLMMEALPGLWSLLGLFIKYRYPILRDLDSEDDGIWKSIKDRTEQLQEIPEGEPTKAKLVVFAKGDKVVRNIPYLKDLPPKVIDGQTHMSVCKPKENFYMPVELLKKLL
ncbi:MAG: alpha/beta hydrolase [Haliscomenobacter sp.]|uniref:esterase/lipase family protein n=1 Tax=Haliscomenobacter sp. TaxID=2717303 RepID=UPI0029BE83E5|nr:alpha/beta hydrolase [Haliscomenobacter sp.]MDX2068137.1 alpha/beta hydrolase [Haliscomenobacter sp.]